MPFLELPLRGLHVLSFPLRSELSRLTPGTLHSSRVWYTENALVHGVRLHDAPPPESAPLDAKKPIVVFLHTAFISGEDEFNGQVRLRDSLSRSFPRRG